MIDNIIRDGEFSVLGTYDLYCTCGRKIIWENIDSFTLFSRCRCGREANATVKGYIIETMKV